MRHTITIAFFLDKNFIKDKIFEILAIQIKNLLT